MLDIPGLGPKKIKALHDELGIETVEQLEAGVQGRARSPGSKGFGEKTQTNICEGINRRRAYASRHLHQRRAAAGGAAAGGAAVASGRDPLQRGGQLAAASGGDRRH